HFTFTLSFSLTVYPFFFYSLFTHRDLHSFPTRRSSDLSWGAACTTTSCPRASARSSPDPSSTARTPHTSRRSVRACCRLWYSHRDRKSTRLNSSHVAISYAVFCLKKKKKWSAQQCMSRA